MLLLTKPLQRECYASFDPKGRKLILSLEPGDMVSVRMKGKKTRYYVSVYHILYMGIANHLLEQDRKKWSEYQLRKKAGANVRKPKKRKRTMIFSRQIHEILNMGK